MGEKLPALYAVSTAQNGDKVRDKVTKNNPIFDGSRVVRMGSIPIHSRLIPASELRFA